MRPRHWRVADVQFHFWDVNGGGDTSWTQTIFNSTLTGVGGCYIHYSRVANQFRLYNDGVTDLTGPVSPGQNAVIENSQCRLNAAGSSVLIAGSVRRPGTLTLRP